MRDQAAWNSRQSQMRAAGTAARQSADANGAPGRRQRVAAEGASMGSERLRDAIRTVAEIAKFDHVFEHFADGVELRITLANSSPTSESTHGRPLVIARLQRLCSGNAPTGVGPVEVYTSGERVVACRDAVFSIAGGVTVRDECALVFDIRDGFIDRLVIHHELSALLDADEAVAPRAESRAMNARARTSPPHLSDPAAAPVANQ